MEHSMRAGRNDRFRHLLALAMAATTALALAAACGGETAADRQRAAERPRARERGPDMVDTPLQRGRVPRIARSPRCRRLQRVVAANMPFARKLRTVSARLQNLGYRGATLVQVPLVLRHPVIANHVPHPGLVRVKTGQQRSTRRTTPRHVVHLAEANALPGHRIDVRSVDLRAITAEVGKPHIVSKNQNYIRLGQYSSRRYRALTAYTLS